MTLKSFNIRVYGILMNEKKQVLVSDERIYFNNREVTKFPGGGLELGEGTKECIVRECKEEMNADVEVVDHLYTTDFFQESAFNEEHQLISIYYIVRPVAPLPYVVNNGPAIYPETITENFRFIDWEHFSADAMTLPIDKIAAALLKERG
ncbi:NUDIX domain-containing protein [Niabella drilacis]|uniref:NUDIX domain-containing protein n=1 Tax=Niabella drilacis (strain DSM 25811 / CCM 8410 / CCUG 62505 / LMG 26954 / E90) TaxID=1285928 RepID=A0A1G7BZZ8_NIADE|nr:NUDIX domain-containing protein [Niabella drilacis]SDE32617.1 NUDIX domain-containing protein [Niabella drilacis]